MNEISVGTKYGLLTVLSLKKGAKNIHGTAACVCDCGGVRAARHTDLRRGRVDRCARCALKLGHSKRLRNDAVEIRLGEKESQYKCNARKKGREWALSRTEARALFQSDCHYCGVPSSFGIDRLNSADGYTTQNSVPCCSDCNYAKRELSVAEFLGLVERIYTWSCLS